MPSRAASPAPGRATKIGRAAACIVLALLVAACVETSPAGPAFPLVPEGAVFVATIDSPARFFNAASDFWNAAGIAKIAGGGLQDFLSKSVPGGEDSARYLDTSRPCSLAIVPIEPGSRSTRTILYLPVLAGSGPSLEKLSSESMKLVAQAKGYAVFATGSGDIEFPPAKSLDLSRLERYPAASLKFWADPAAIRLPSKASPGGFDPIEKAARGFVAGEAAAPVARLSALGESGLAFLRQLGSADGAIVPGPRGITVRLGAASLAGSEADRLIALGAADPSALDLAPRLSSRALLASAWSIDPGLMAELSGKLLAPVFSVLGLPDTAVDAVSSLESRFAAAAGPRGASNLDFELDASAFSGLDDKDPAALEAAIRRGFSIDHEILVETRDDALFAKLVGGIGTDPDMGLLLKAYADVLGLGITLQNQDRIQGSFVYGDLGLSFKLLDAARFEAKRGIKSESAKAATEAALDAFGSKFGMRWTIAQGWFSATTGDLAALKTLSARSTAESPLTAEPGFADFAKDLPGKVLSVGSFSTRRLAEIGSSLIPGLSASSSKTAAKPDPGRFSAWYGYLSAGPGGADGASARTGAWLEAGFFIPSGDAAAIVELGAPLLGQRAR
jgi:hypothetical protein